MKTSDSIKAIAPAFAKAQAAVANTVKSAVNPHFKNKYVPLDDLIPVVKSALLAEGIAFVQGAEPSEGDVLHLTTRLIHTSGEWIESTLSMKPSKADPQGIGSCITYARRYSLAAMVGVVSDDDDDANAASAPAKAAPKEKAAPAAIPPGGNAHDERAALMGRIAVQKSRPAVKDMQEIVWIEMLKKCFEVETKNAIAALTPMELKIGIDKLAATIDEMEQQ